MTAETKNNTEPVAPATVPTASTPSTENSPTKNADNSTTSPTTTSPTTKKEKSLKHRLKNDASLQGNDVEHRHEDDWTQRDWNPIDKLRSDLFNAMAEGGNPVLNFMNTRFQS